ncbi:hypothetical protein [Rhodanobacter koreensis]
MAYTALAIHVHAGHAASGSAATRSRETTSKQILVMRISVELIDSARRPRRYQKSPDKMLSA